MQEEGAFRWRDFLIQRAYEKKNNIHGQDDTTVHNIAGNVATRRDLGAVERLGYH